MLVYQLVQFLITYTYNTKFFTNKVLKTINKQLSNHIIYGKNEFKVSGLQYFAYQNVNAS